MCTYTIRNLPLPLVHFSFTFGNLPSPLGVCTSFMDAPFIICHSYFWTILNYDYSKQKKMTNKKSAIIRMQKMSNHVFIILVRPWFIQSQICPYFGLSVKNSQIKYQVIRWGGLIYYLVSDELPSNWLYVIYVGFDTFLNIFDSTVYKLRAINMMMSFDLF